MDIKEDIKEDINDELSSYSENVVIRKKIKLPVKILILFFIFIVIMYIWMHMVEPKLLFVRDIPLHNSKISTAYDGLTMVSFSDIHFGRTINEKELDKVIEKINSLDSDIVIFNGDLFDEYITYNDEHFNYLKNSFKNIRAKHKKYAITGDKDLIYYDKYLEILKDSDFVILDNINEAFYYNYNEPVYIGGIGSVNENFEIDYSLFKKDSLQIIVCHEPICFNDQNLNYDYILASHTLGGLIRFPGYDGLVKFSNTDNYSKGLYTNQKGAMFVSSGIGTQDFSLRLYNPPTIYFYRFFAKK